MLKGIMVTVLRSTLGDCTNGGVSSKNDRFLLVGEEVPEIVNNDGYFPVLKLVKRDLFGQIYLHCEPTDKPERHYMAGGNYIYSSDSRFRESVNRYPISIHDRVE